MLVFFFLSVTGSLALDLLIATFIISVFAIAVSGGAFIMNVRLWVIQPLQGIMVSPQRWHFQFAFREA